MAAEGIRYVNAEEAKKLLGQCVKGIWIPYHLKVKGRDFGRLRLATPTDDRKYTQAYKSGVHGYIPTLFEKVNKAKNVEDWWLFIAEGEFKALSMLEAGYSAVGAGGIQNCLKKGDKKADKNAARELVTEFAKVVTANKPKGIAFVGDADTALIPDFSKAMVRLAKAIKLPLILPRVPVDARGKGIDDCRAELNGEFNAWFDAIVASAVVVNPQAEPSILALELLRREIEALKRLTDKTAVTRENAINRSVKLAAGFDKEADVKDEIIRIACDTFGIAPDEFRKKVEQASAENSQKRTEFLRAKAKELAMKNAGVSHCASPSLSAPAPTMENAVPPGQPVPVTPAVTLAKMIAGVPKPKARSIATPYLASSPNDWFDHYFPTLKRKYGPAALEQQPKKKSGLPFVASINEDFLSATLGLEASPDEPAIYLPVEDRFYKYELESGIFRHKTPAQLEGLYSNTLKECGQACAGEFDVNNLMFSLRKSSKMMGVSRRATATLHEHDEFFDATLKDYIACKNCMVRVSDLQSLEFSPQYHRRNKLGIDYVPGAKCDRFLNELMRPAVSEADLDLLQRWSGMALLGENVAQKVMMLLGTAGGGKGTFIRVLTGIIGLENLAELRTKHLDNSRFELGLMVGKTLLYGADVAADFMSEKGAYGLKKITGGDPITPEHKNARTNRTIEGKFNVVLSANCRLQVRLENDEGAWLRRLVIIDYTQPPVSKPIPDFDKILLRDEGSGILNWMLDGLMKLKAEGWNLTLTAQQKARVENLLCESNNLTLFIRDCLQKDDQHSITVSDAYVVYTEYCSQRNWTAIGRYEFGSQIEAAVAAQFGVAMRHDVVDANQKAQRGWKGIGLQP